MAGLDGVVFAPRRPVRGAYAGRHASKQRGHSVEFNDYREYTPGDEVGDIDWKVFGRSDRLYIKRFEHQTDMTVHLIVDASASMRYAGLGDPGGDDKATTWIEKLKLKAKARADSRADDGIINPSKYDQACLLAGAIAFLAVRQQDRVGFTAAQVGTSYGLEARGGYGHLYRLLDVMESVRPGGEAGLVGRLEDRVKRGARGGLTVVFSDLLEDREPVLRALGALTAAGGEAIVFHVLHGDELDLPDVSEAVFVDSETGGRVRIDVRDVRRTYRAQVQAEGEAWRAGLSARGVDYRRVTTGADTHEAIRDYLVARSALR